MMADLLDYLRTYLYVVPRQIHQVQTEVLGYAPRPALSRRNCLVERRSVYVGWSNVFERPH